LKRQQDIAEYVSKQANKWIGRQGGYKVHVREGGLGLNLTETGRKLD